MLSHYDREVIVSAEPTDVLATTGGQATDNLKAVVMALIPVLKDRPNWAALGRLAATARLTRAVWLRQQVEKVLSPEQTSSIPRSLTVGDLVLDLRSFNCCYRGNPINLAAKEFSILLELACHPGELVAPAVLLEMLWEGLPQESALVVLRTTFSRLRKRFGADCPVRAVHQGVVTVGYIFEVAGTA